MPAYEPSQVEPTVKSPEPVSLHSPYTPFTDGCVSELGPPQPRSHWLSEESVASASVSEPPPILPQRRLSALSQKARASHQSTMVIGSVSSSVMSPASGAYLMFQEHSGGWPLTSSP